MQGRPDGADAEYVGALFDEPRHLHLAGGKRRGGPLVTQDIETISIVDRVAHMIAKKHAFPDALAYRFAGRRRVASGALSVGHDTGEGLDRLPADTRYYGECNQYGGG